MLELDAIEAPTAGRWEQQSEVSALPGIDNVEDGIGGQFCTAVLDRGQIRGGIGEGPVLLADDEGSVEIFNKGTHSAFAFTKDPGCLKFLDQLRQHGLVVTFTEGQIEGDPQPLVHGVQSL